MAEISTDGDTNIKKDTGMSGRIVPAGIPVIYRWAPNPCGIVGRHVDHFRIRRYDFDDWLAGICRVDHLLLWG
jgi:hypothetical protein